ALMILPRTWALLRESVDVLLEATPQGHRPRRGPPLHSPHARRRGRPRPARADHHLGDAGAIGPRRGRRPRARLRRRVHPRRPRALPVGFQNSATGPGLVFYAARSYSLVRPPGTGRRSIRFRDRSATG